MKKALLLFTFLLPLTVTSLVEAAEKPGNAAQQKRIAPVAKTQNIDPTSGIEFVLVKGGCFQMGNATADGNRNQKPVHEVCIGDFNIGKYEVTQAQWQKVMGMTPAGNECGPSCPVTMVSWDMVQEFIAKLNKLSGKKYRLPTEAEWEYAARSGGKDEKWAGTNEEIKLIDYAWFDQNSPEGVIRPSGKKKANGLGLYDMSGNVQEWCQDWYDEGFYAISQKDNPVGPAAGKKRVVRGGAFSMTSERVKTTARYWDKPDVAESSTGFRLILTAK